MRRFYSWAYGYTFTNSSQSILHYRGSGGGTRWSDIVDENM
jgi:hypothetical protein